MPRWSICDCQGMSGVSTLWSGAKNVLFPVQCAGCHVWDTHLCAACERLSRGEPTSFVFDDCTGHPDVEVVALGAYDGPLRSIVLTAKHDENCDLSTFLTLGGVGLGEEIGRRLARTVAKPGGRPLLPVRVWVVPVPSSHRRRRQRREIVPQVADGVATGIRRAVVTSAKVVPAVRLRRWAHGQSGRSAVARRLGRRESMRLVLKPPERTAIVVVDDVVTSGATLRAVIDTLESDGCHRVVAAAALAVA